MNKNLWKFLLCVGAVPFVIPVILGLYHMVIESWLLIDWLFLYSVIYWPTYLIGLGLIVLAAIKLKKK